MCKVDPHPSFGQSCTVWSYLKDRASDARWLANPIRISQYRRWRHLRVTLWWRHQSAFGGELKNSGLLMTSPPGTFWPGQVRPGEQAVMRKSTGSFEESNLRPSGGLTQYRPTKLTRRWEANWSSCNCWFQSNHMKCMSCRSCKQRHLAQSQGE